MVILQQNETCNSAFAYRCQSIAKSLLQFVLPCAAVGFHTFVISSSNFFCRESNFLQLNDNDIRKQTTTRHTCNIYDDFPAKCSSYLRHAFIISSSYFVILRHAPPMTLPDPEAGAFFEPRNRTLQNAIIFLECIGSAGCPRAVGKGGDR